MTFTDVTINPKNVHSVHVWQGHDLVYVGRIINKDIKWEDIDGGTVALPPARSQPEGREC